MNGHPGQRGKLHRREPWQRVALRNSLRYARATAATALSLALLLPGLPGNGIAFAESQTAAPSTGQTSSAQKNAGQSAAPATKTTPKKKKTAKHHPSVPCRTGCKTTTSIPESMATTPEEIALQKEMSDLAHEVHSGVAGAYEKLSAFAVRNSANVWGARAALALGYDDYSRNRAAQAVAWLGKAQNDELLREYALYWSAQAKKSLKRDADSFADLSVMAKDYPNTAIKEQFLEAYAPEADALGKPQEALAALNAYGAIGSRPALLLERAQAYQALRQYAKAAKDYQTLFYGFPLTDESKAAGISLTAIAKILGKEYAYPGVELQAQRAQLFFDAHKWKEARAEYQKLLGMLKDPANPTRQLAQVRMAECRQYPKAAPSELARVTATDPDVDAERVYALSQAYRSEKNEGEMVAQVELAAKKYPQSKWTEETLMAAGNFYWVALQREKAAGYYQRLMDGFPGGKNALNAEWRVAWIAFLDKQTDADARLTAFLVKYPTSGNAVDAVYWLGRNAERGGNPGHARAYYQKAIDRFPQTYFAHAAAARLAKLPAGDAEAADVLAKIPDAPILRSFEEPIGPPVAGHWNRAQALRTIGFDSSAELELKAGFAATGSPRFLLEAAQTAFDQGHFGTGMAYGRLMVPNFDSRKIDEIPAAAWKTLYPLPYEAALRREAARNNFDPMLAAGLIRQESTFQADAVSHANAIGLMQVLPKTGKLLAKQLKVKYTKSTLFDPDLNLELGMVYIAELLRATGAPEYAAAAYNAGEDRIALWKGERNYDEIPELVESIPFTETREYVQVVLRNAEVYRAVYGTTAVAPAATQASVSNSR